MNQKLLTEFYVFMNKLNAQRLMLKVQPGAWQTTLGEMIQDLQVRARKAYDAENRGKPQPPAARGKVLKKKPKKR